MRSVYKIQSPRCSSPCDYLVDCSQPSIFFVFLFDPWRHGFWFWLCLPCSRFSWSWRSCPRHVYTNLYMLLFQTDICKISTKRQAIYCSSFIGLISLNGQGVELNWWQGTNNSSWKMSTASLFFLLSSLTDLNPRLLCAPCSLRSRFFCMCK